MCHFHCCRPCSCARAAGLYTDPSTGACANASDPASYSCAFGSGDSCVRCPIGALCPGGARAWPRVGYYSASQSLPSVTACTPPQPSQRCLGWDGLLGRTQCGPTYRQGSYMCESCAVGAYAVGDGSCAWCPVASRWGRYLGLIQLIAGILAFSALVYLAILLVVMRTGGTLRGGVKKFAVLVRPLHLVAPPAACLPLHAPSAGLWTAISCCRLRGA
jgi:hypothetical protein